MITLDDLDPAVGGPLTELVDGVWDGRIDPALLERCRLAMCRRWALPPATARPPDAPWVGEHLDDRDRACVAFTEQWLDDARGITDEMTDAVRHHLTDRECAAFTIALATVEAQLRAALALRMLA